MSKSKLLYAVATAFALAACSRYVPEDVGYCIRTGDKSFEIWTDVVAAETMLYASENMRFSARLNQFQGDVSVGENTIESASGLFTADLTNKQCWVNTIGSSMTNDVYTMRELPANQPS